VCSSDLPEKDSGDLEFSVNLNATQGDRALLKKLTDIGYKVPKITGKNAEGEYEQKYSTGELALQKILSSGDPKYPAGDPAIRAILKTRELGKILNVYLNSRLCSRLCESEKIFLFLSSYNAAGTLTGRRTSRKHIFGYGNNAQNFPKHSDVAQIFRKCLIPRRGHVFLMVDQMQAEEWPVSALSGNTTALHELRTGVDRHSKLASAVFGEYIPAKKSPDWDKAKHDMKRYLGKKIKHARNYGMKKKRMSESLAQEGFSVTEAVCEMLLARAAAVDPTVDSVFHKYVQDCLSNDHLLVTPFGRERMFLGARPNNDNNSLFNEAYSYIPQSTVGDNTGFALYQLESISEDKGEEGVIVQEGHDSIVQDIPADTGTILRYLERTLKAFKRTITFHNGISLEIPIEATLALDFNNEIEIESFDEKGIEDAMNKLYGKAEAAA
jgi:DNA polymerase I-like protein with 3'-5' exonuclease and polymerase domains